ncbi:radical SAM protein [Myxococcota bacterium]
MLATLNRFKRDLARVHSEGPPRIVFWAITNHCNAACATCGFYLLPRAQRMHCDLADAKKAIAVLARSNIRLVSLTGGEPLLHPHLFEICDEVNRCGIEISYIPTNGLLVDDERAKLLKRARAKVVGISIEPLGKDGMGVTRKIKDLHGVVAGARERLDRQGVANYAGILLSTATRDIRATLSLARELGFTKVSFSYPQLEQDSTYVAARKTSVIELSAADVAEMVSAIKAAKRSFRGLAIYNTDESLDDLVRFYRQEPRRYPCWGGRRLYYMDWHFDLYPCFALSRRYGNVLHMDQLLAGQEASLCDLCTQQAFRDFGPLYRGIGAIAEGFREIGRGRPLRGVRCLTENDALAGMYSLLEVYRGGFV